MSRSTPPTPSPAARRALRIRRWALGALILTQLAVVAGAVGGPWWQAFLADQPLGPPMTGQAFASRVLAAQPDTPPPPPSDRPVTPNQALQRDTPPPQPTDPGFWGRPGVLAHLALLACAGAFFFASYDLVADDTIQLPTFICSVVIAATAGLVAYEILVSERTLRAIIARLEAESDDSTSLLDKVGQLTLRPQWGGALFFLAAPLHLLISTYLTFFAPRDTSENS